MLNFTRSEYFLFLLPHIIAWIVYIEVYHTVRLDFWMTPSTFTFPLLNNTIFGCCMVQTMRLMRQHENNPRIRTSTLPFAFVVMLLVLNTVITSLVVKFLLAKIYLDYLVWLSWAGFAIAVLTGIGILMLTGQLWMIASLFAANSIYLTSLYAYSFAVGLSCGDNPICHWLHPEGSSNYVAVYPKHLT